MSINVNDPSAQNAGAERSRQIMRAATTMPMASNKALAVTKEEFEVGHDLLLNNEGFIIGARGQRLMRLATETPIVTIGKTGAGKGVAAAITNLLDHPGSIFSLEIGGTTLKSTYNYRKNALGQKVYVFDPHNITGLESAHYNPLDDLDPSSPKFFSQVSTLVRSIVKTEDGQQENQAYFQKSDRGLITAMIIYLKLADKALVPQEQRNLVHLAKIFSSFPSEQWDRHINELKRWKGKYNILLNEFGNYLGTAKNGDLNARSIVSSAAGWLRFLADDDLAKYLTKSDFSMRDLRNDKISIYLVMEGLDHFITYHPWLRFMVENAINFIPNPGDGGAGFQHKDRILFMIDEMTHLGRLDAVMTGAQTVRQKGIVLWSMFQNIGDLIHVYGREKAHSFIAASECVQIFQVTEPETLDYVAKYAGRKLVYVPSVSEAITHGQADMTNWSISKSHSEQLSNQVTKNWADTTSQGTARTDGTSNSQGNSSSSGGNSSWGSTYNWGNSNMNGSNFSWGSNQSSTVQQGTSRQEGAGTAEGYSSGDTKTDQTGGGESKNHGQTYTVQYAPQIIPAVDFREILDVLSGQSQLLLINNKDASRFLLDFQARFYQVEELRYRAEGMKLMPPPALPKLVSPTGSFLAAAEALTKAALDMNTVSISVPVYQERSFEMPTSVADLQNSVDTHLANVRSRQEEADRKSSDVMKLQEEQHQRKKELSELEKDEREKAETLSAIPQDGMFKRWRNRKSHQTAEEAIRLASEARHSKLAEHEALEKKIASAMSDLADSISEINAAKLQGNDLLRRAAEIIDNVVTESRSLERALADDENTHNKLLERIRHMAQLNARSREVCRLSIAAIKQQKDEIHQIFSYPELTEEWRAYADHLRDYADHHQTRHSFSSRQPSFSLPQIDFPEIAVETPMNVDWQEIKKAANSLTIPVAKEARSMSLPEAIAAEPYNYGNLLAFSRKVKSMGADGFSSERATEMIGDLMPLLDQHAHRFQLYVTARAQVLRRSAQKLSTVAKATSVEQEDVQRSLYELRALQTMTNGVLGRVNEAIPHLCDQLICDIKESVGDIYERLGQQPANTEPRALLPPNGYTANRSGVTAEQEATRPIGATEDDEYLLSLKRGPA